jgi:hypothetical protein
VNVSPALAVRTIYYWRVRAVNATGAGPWSTVYNTITLSTSPLIEHQQLK